MVGQHWPNIGSMCHVCWGSVSPVNMTHWTNGTVFNAGPALVQSQINIIMLAVGPVSLYSYWSRLLICVNSLAVPLDIPVWGWDSKSASATWWHCDCEQAWHPPTVTSHWQQQLSDELPAAPSSDNNATVWDEQLEEFWFILAPSLSVFISASCLWWAACVLSLSIWQASGEDALCVISTAYSSSDIISVLSSRRVCSDTSVPQSAGWRGTASSEPGAPLSLSASSFAIFSACSFFSSP